MESKWALLRNRREDCPPPASVSQFTMPSCRIVHSWGDVIRAGWAWWASSSRPLSVCTVCLEQEEGCKSIEDGRKIDRRLGNLLVLTHAVPYEFE